MFRPPPTIVEIGTEEDLKQYEEMIKKRNIPLTPPSKPYQVFISPESQTRGRTIITTPIGQIDSPE